MFGLSAGRSIAAAVLALVCASDLSAQSSASSFSIRFFGTGSAQRDRIKIPVDDDVAGSAGNTPIDVGAGDFTIEFWVKGNLTDNVTANAGGDVDLLTNAWMDGNVVVDRDILGGSDADFGISIAGGYVRFGTGRGQGPTFDGEHTLEGDVLVLDGSWHHVAVVRQQSSGRKFIYVDGALDVASIAGASTANLSYPDVGVVGAQDALGRFLVVGAAKHDLAQFRSFNGFVDEVRIWNRVRTRVQVLEALDRVLLPNTPGLVGSYRLEEGTGTVTHDTSGANAPSGTIASGPAMALWMASAANGSNTAVVSNTGLPPGFERTPLVTNLVEPTTLEFLPDGRLLIGERGGAIKVYANGQLQAAPLLQIAVDTTNGERGLVGLAAHPQFATNGFLYAFYTTAEPRDRVARFTVIGASADPLSETLIWQNDHLASDYHHGGALAFGVDGKLYVAVGDNYVAARAQEMSAFDGKLLRLNDDGSVPSGNPFVGAPGAKPQIYAYGLRNPFRTSVDPQTGQMWIGDVGGNNLTSWEEANLVQPAANFGWPDSEANDCFLADCSAVAKPHFAYQHIDPEYYLLVPQGSITMGPRVRAPQFPVGYRDCLYVGDFVNRWIRRLVFDANGDVVADPLFLYPPYAGTV
ncbi:MAG: PQQ-dependent sugar dehydrogenase, partial [Planctomycetes bacterium]|nr:PQQ-dependent sugar dehydrogenase [Planctomycetota bacterium]